MNKSIHKPDSDNKVYVIPCNHYNKTKEKLAELFNMMGGIKQFVKAGEKIVLKPNLLMPANPEKAVTTHPSILEALGSLVQSQNTKPVIADSLGSGYVYTQQILKKLYTKCGIKQAAQNSGIPLNYDTSYESIFFPEGKLIKRFEVIKPVVESDAVFNLCKLKTHTFMIITGAIKNIFGVIPGRTKPGYHAKLNDTAYFASMLLDLAAYIKPRLSIMDAVIGMEGNGPSAGNPVKIGYLLASTNPLALDLIAGEITGLPREQNPVLIEAQKRNWIPYSSEEIEIIGSNLEELRIPGFKLPETVVKGSGFDMIPSFLSRTAHYFAKSATSLKPRIDKNKCTACGTCKEACPVKAINIIDKKYAHINTKECIRCYCCHEMCEYQAVKLHKNFLYRLANRAESFSCASQ
ncbi:MAG: DUF362 domain-containing protein [Candidatus Aminicenantaceae bacterium]